MIAHVYGAKAPKTSPGLEPGISCSVGRRLIHWALRTDVDLVQLVMMTVSVSNQLLLLAPGLVQIIVVLLLAQKAYILPKTYIRWGSNSRNKVD